MDTFQIQNKVTWMHGLRPFTLDENVIEDKDVKAKAEILGLREDNTWKADFQDSDLTIVFGKLENLILSDRALKLLIPLPTMYHCEACLSRVVNIKRRARNRLDLKS
jgi:hypothetical protein